MLQLEQSFDAFHRASTLKLTRAVFFVSAALLLQMVVMSFLDYRGAIPQWYVNFGAFCFGPSMLLFGLLLMKPKYHRLSRLFYVLACIQGWLAAIVLIENSAWVAGRPLYIEATYLILVSIYFFSPLRLSHAIWVGFVPSLVLAALIVLRADSFSESIYSLSFISAFNLLGIAARYASENHLRRIYELQQRLSGLANKDPLTALPNRRGFDRHLNHLNTDAAKTESYVFVIFDLDNFKQYNDQYGHPTGDILLKALGKKLLALTTNNSEGFVARFGGDEFVGLWPCVDETEANSIANLIREELKAVIAEDAKERPSRLCLSIGIAWQTSSEKINLSQLYERSDRALYKAKLAAKTIQIDQTQQQQLLKQG